MSRVEIEERVIRLTEEKFGPYNLNNLQAEFKKHYRPGQNAIVSSGTGTGKTICGLIAMKYAQNPLYVVPTSAKILAEKKDELVKAGIEGEVKTYAKVSEELRAGNTLSNYDLVVLDEFHEYLRNSRAIEVLMDILKNDIPYVMLSATLPEEFVQKLDPDLYLVAPNLSWTKIVEDRYIKMAPNNKQFPETLMREIEEGTIVFFPSRNQLWKFALKFDPINETLPEKPAKEFDLKVGIYCSDVPKEERDKVIKTFEEGKIKALFATTGLSQGVNIKARKGVIVVINNRGQMLPEGHMVAQTRGRIGRPLEGKEEEAKLVTICAIDPEKVKEELDPKNMNPVPWYLTTEEGKEDLVIFSAKDTNEVNPTYLVKLPIAFENSQEMNETIEALIRNGFLNEDLRLTSDGVTALKSGLTPRTIMEVREILKIEIPFVRDILLAARIARIRRMPENVGGDQIQERCQKAQMPIIERLKKLGLYSLSKTDISVLTYAAGRYFTHGVPLLGDIARARDSMDTIVNVVEVMELYMKFFPDKEEFARHLLSFAYGVNPKYSPITTVEGIGYALGNIAALWLERKGVQEIGFEDVDMLQEYFEEPPHDLELLLLTVYEDASKIRGQITKLKSIMTQEEVPRNTPFAIKKLIES